MKKSTRRPSINNMKYCNLCGEAVLIYSIIDNAPCCEDCIPVKKMKKAIPNEAKMINTILGEVEKIRQGQEDLLSYNEHKTSSKTDCTSS